MQTAQENLSFGNAIVSDGDEQAHGHHVGDCSQFSQSRVEQQTPSVGPLSSPLAVDKQETAASQGTH